jgi:hypothetical protein
MGPILGFVQWVWLQAESISWRVFGKGSFEDHGRHSTR